MAKEDYREKLEESRQEIEVDGEKSRASRAKRKPKKRKNPLISFLFVVFILIPLSVLIYVKFFYVPKPVEVAKTDDSVVQVETNETESEKDTETDPKQTDEIELTAEEQEALAKEQAKAAEEAAKQEVAAEIETPVVEEPEQEPTSARTHVVKSNETLYRIAMTYYKDPSAVEKIKQANNLRSESIQVGQTLILP